MSEPNEEREERVATSTFIECPVCEEYVELLITVNIVIRQFSYLEENASRVFIGLSPRESYNVHSCWPKEQL